MWTLTFNIDVYAGLEFHGEVVGKDCDLLYELFDQSLIKLCDIGFLRHRHVRFCGADRQKREGQDELYIEKWIKKRPDIVVSGGEF
ncbi:hypothetical protein AALA79_16625 [Lachnospiraceae bacterium 64-25]